MKIETSVHPNKTLYAILDPRGNLNIHTLRYCRKDSIASWFKKEDWKVARKTGFKCVKFSVSFEEI